jgi:hypothetical protein
MNNTAPEINFLLPNFYKIEGILNVPPLKLMALGDSKIRLHCHADLFAHYAASIGP